MLARWASYDKKTLARQVIPLALGYRTALSSRPVMVKGGVYINVLHNGELSSYNTNILWIVLILTEEIISCNPGLDVES